MMTQKKWFQLIQNQFEIAFSSTVNVHMTSYHVNEESVYELDDEVCFLT